MTLLFLFIILLISNPIAFVLSCIGVVKDKKYSKAYALITAITLGVFAYSYNPTGHSDLVRYFQQLELMSNIPFNEVFGYGEEGLFVQNIIFWIIAKLQLPNLLPALTVAVVYGVTFYITADYAVSKGKRENIWKVLLIQFLALSFFNIANNIRNVSAFALIILAVYRDLEKKQYDIITLLLYILPVFLHKAAFILIILRLAMFISRRNVIIPILTIFLIPQIIIWGFEYRAFFTRFGLIGNIISNAFITAYRATISTSDWAITVTTSGYYITHRYLTMILTALLLISVLVYSSKKKISLVNVFFSYLCVFTLSCNIFRTPAYWRFYTAMICIGGPFILTLISEKVFKSIHPSIIQLALFAYVLVFFVLQLYGSRNDFSTANMVYNTLINPLGVILGKIILQLFLL